MSIILPERIKILNWVTLVYQLRRLFYLLTLEITQLLAQVISMNAIICTFCDTWQPELIAIECGV